ncbi:MAG: GntG family PLP-dependent aldolase [Candidatus Izemoplasmatales bacterium]|jgi:threonine aldolase
MTYIDLRSDTVTEPTPQMRQAMFDAPVGDDVFSDDETMNHFEKHVANLFRKEASIFVPSGTFANQLALFTHCQRGDEVIVDQDAHIVIHESGASSIIAGVQLFTMENHFGMWDLAKFERTIKERTVSTTRTKLVCLENAFGGRVLPLDYMKKVYDIAKSRHLMVHLDGARIFNAATFLNVAPAELAQFADTISVCLSKGLSAPIGTVLVGSTAFIEEARYRRKIMGGGMRQVGFLAAMGQIAVDEMSQRLHEDHLLASRMASLLSEIPGIIIDETQRDINMVFFDIDDPRKYELDRYLLKHGVKILPYEGVFRFVTHHGLNEADIKTAIALVGQYFQ